MKKPQSTAKCHLEPQINHVDTFPLIYNEIMIFLCQNSFIHADPLQNSLSIRPKHPTTTDLKHTQKSQQPIHSPLAEAETQGAVQSKNTTRVNIVCPFSAARRIKNGHRKKKESAAEVALKGQKERQSKSKLLLLCFIWEEGRLQTPRSSTKYEITSKSLTWGAQIWQRLLPLTDAASF